MVDQVGGDHYAGEYQHWDWAIDTRLPPMEYAATKYISRWWKKNGIQDLRKARSYIEKLRETAQRQPGWLSGNRPRAGSPLLHKYFDSSKIPTQERALIILIDLIDDEEALNNVLSTIDKYIATAKGGLENGHAPYAVAPAHWLTTQPHGQQMEPCGGAGGATTQPSATADASVDGKTGHPAPFGYEGED